MAWFGTANPMDELVEKATDSAIPVGSEDLALNLDICDRIRSKAVSAKDAMRALKKRISNKNPNVQLLALNLSDLCVKNGGSHFLTEVASREFVDNMTSLLRAPGGINHEVRQRMIELIQSWALLFEARSTELGYMISTYRSLKHEGIQFPPEERVTAAFVDSAAPPDWADSDVCMRCRNTFTFRNRKHHCRNCGNAFCGQCSSQSMALVHLGVTTPVRVCDGCYSKKQAPVPLATPTAPRDVVPDYQQPRKASINTSNEDVELKRALELSLQEHRSIAEPAKVESKPKPDTIDEDAEMAAAIAASLQDVAPAPVKETYSYPVLKQSTQTYPSYSLTPVSTIDDTMTQPLYRPATFELSNSEQENIYLFATIVDRLKHDQKGAILRDSQVQELYESISTIRPKLARSLGDTVGKYESLIDTHSKLTSAIKFYDRILENRLATTYSRDPFAHEKGQYGIPTNQGYEAQSRYPEPAQSYNHPGRYPASSQYQQEYHSTSAQQQQQQQQQPIAKIEAPKEEVSLIDL